MTTEARNHCTNTTVSSNGHAVGQSSLALLTGVYLTIVDSDGEKPWRKTRLQSNYVDNVSIDPSKPPSTLLYSYWEDVSVFSVSYIIDIFIIIDIIIGMLLKHPMVQKHGGAHNQDESCAGIDLLTTAVLSAPAPTS